MPSGGWNRKSDEHRKLTGTFRPSDSDAAKARRLAEKVFAGPAFKDVPDPTLPLSRYAERIYFQFAGRLLDQGKLTASTAEICELIAVVKDDQHIRVTSGKTVPTYSIRELSKHIASLKLIEDTQPIGGSVGAPKEENPFRIIGKVIRPFAPRATLKKS
jgi:hypothetical protein